MNKINFNEEYNLLNSVLRKIKTHKRIKIGLTLHKKQGNELIEVYPDEVFKENEKWKFKIDGIVYSFPKSNLPKYKVGEVVAIAQSYKEVFEYYKNLGESSILKTLEQYKNSKAWTNKMFVKAELMPHAIRIKDIRAERIQNISNEDCLKEGIEYGSNSFYCLKNISLNSKHWLGNNIREAFSNLISKTERKIKWNDNPWVWVYIFKLVK